MTRTLPLLAAAASALALTACATVTAGTAPVALPQELAARSHINVVRMTSDWVSGNPDFTDTFTDAVHENLATAPAGRRSWTSISTSPTRGARTG